MGEVEEPVWLIGFLEVLLFAGVDEEISVFEDDVAVLGETTEMVATYELALEDQVSLEKGAICFCHLLIYYIVIGIK